MTFSNIPTHFLDDFLLLKESLFFQQMDILLKKSLIAMDF